MDTITGSLVREELVNLDCHAQDQKQLLEQLSDRLFEKGYVASSFKEALLEREAVFPTGLQLENTAVAIPHTYAEHVQKPFIYINKLSNPIRFIQMGTDDVEVSVSFVMVLGISEPQEQVGLLMELMEKFADLAFVQQLEMARTSTEVVTLFSR